MLSLAELVHGKSFVMPDGRSAILAIEQICSLKLHGNIVLFDGFDPTYATLEFAPPSGGDRCAVSAVYAHVSGESVLVGVVLGDIRSKGDWSIMSAIGGSLEVAGQDESVLYGLECETKVLGLTHLGRYSEINGDTDRSSGLVGELKKSLSSAGQDQVGIVGNTNGADAAVFVLPEDHDEGSPFVDVLVNRSSGGESKAAFIQFHSANVPIARPRLAVSRVSLREKAG